MATTQPKTYQIERATIGGEWHTIADLFSSKLRAQRELKALRALGLHTFIFRLVEIDNAAECTRRVIQ